MARDKLRQVPSSITGELGSLLNSWWQVLNSEPHISRFSGTDPNTSIVSGFPGDLTINVGSASTWTRVWVMSGSASSIATTGWKMVRMA